MTVNINLEVLKADHITPDDFVFLWGLFNQKDVLDMIEIYPNFVPLEEKGFIKIGDSDWILTNQGRKLFEPQGLDAKWIQFYTSYPIRVSNGKGGYRALRDSGSDTKFALKCKEKYLAILKKNPNLHETILKAMEVYVKNESPYLQGLEVFINNQSWNKYVDMKIEDKEDTNEVGI